MRERHRPYLSWDYESLAPEAFGRDFPVRALIAGHCILSFSCFAIPGFGTIVDLSEKLTDDLSRKGSKFRKFHESEGFRQSGIYFAWFTGRLDR
jgi:hypothetical protein